MRSLVHTTFASLIVILCVSAPTHAAEKLKLCKKGTTVYASKKCGKGSATLDLSSLAGHDGANGSDGADGSLAVYGDGSAGPLAVTSGVQSLTTTPPAGNNLQFTTCTVAASASLVVPSGTIIRCSESATIAGSIIVISPTNGGRASGSGTATSVVSGVIQPPGAGISSRPATAGEAAHPNAGSSFLLGGMGGEGIASGYLGDSGRFLGSLLRAPHLSGGGGAAPSGSGSVASSEGGRGGGSVILIAKKTITISGSIKADAFITQSFTIGGGGGGGGGIVILAAGTSIAFSGSGFVQAKGGDGGSSGSSTGPGGGGGGGLIQYIAPSVPTIDSSNSKVSAGVGGSYVSSGITATGLRQGGGGGGGSAGSGGAGGSVPEHTGTQTASSGIDGEDGIATSIVADPATLLLGL